MMPGHQGAAADWLFDRGQVVVPCWPQGPSLEVKGGSQVQGSISQGASCLLVPARWPAATAGQGLARRGDSADGSGQASEFFHFAMCWQLSLLCKEGLFGPRAWSWEGRGKCALGAL